MPITAHANESGSSNFMIHPASSTLGSRPAGADENMVARAVALVTEIVAADEASVHDFAAFDGVLQNLRFFSPEQLERVRASFGDALNTPETMQGFAYLKPHGYAGDFEIIDRIYCERVSADPRLARWDRYFHAQAAPRAVRNRKAYFHAQLDRHAARRQPLRVLNVASGPGRCMAEWLHARPAAAVHFDCIELDAAAIAHARELTGHFTDRVAFIQQNALRFTPTEPYDLIWAAGICDYFTDPIFTRLLQRLVPALRSAGELVAGNFSEADPTRPYMEILGEWRLHRRSAEKLRAIAAAAGVVSTRIKIGAEPEGVNLFLHIAGPVP